MGYLSRESLACCMTFHRRRQEGVFHPVWRTGATLSVLTGISQLLQLGVQLALARLYGTGPQVDAYVAAVTGPQLVASLLVATSAQLVVPALAREREKGGRSYARARTAVLLWIGAIAAAAAALFILAPQQVVGLLFPWLGGMGAKLAPHYLPFAGAALVPSALSVYLAQTHNVRERYYLPVAVGIATAALTLALFLFLHPLYGVSALLMAQLIAAIVGALALLASELALAPGPAALWHPIVGRLARLSAPVAVIAVNTRVNLTVDRFFASMAGEGALAVLHYADRWIGLTQAVLILPFVTIFYTDMARTHVAGGRLGEAGRRALAVMLYLGVPLAAGTWVAAPDLAALLLSGSASAGGVGAPLLAACLRAYVMALALAGLGSVLVRAFYIREETRLLMWVAGVVPMALNAALDAWVIRSHGVVGLAAVTSLLAAGVIAVLLVLLGKKEPGLVAGPLAGELARAGLACAGFWPLAWGLRALLGGEGFALAGARLAALALIGAGGYFWLTWLLGSHQAREIFQMRRRSGEPPPAQAPALESDEPL